MKFIKFPHHRTLAKHAPAGGLLAAVAWLAGCPAEPSTIDAGKPNLAKIADDGFDPIDNGRDRNDYPWEMEFFQPDGAFDGRLYVGTGNAVAHGVLARVGIQLSDLPIYRPPEIRRYRPDLGPQSWERVLDYRDIEPGPDWRTSGFRALKAYRGAADGVLWLYAGSFGEAPTLWRTTTGDPGDWQVMWRHARPGSIRALAEHNGLLYIAVTHEYNDPAEAGEIWATDGQRVWPVMTDGFGSVENTGVFSLVSWNGWLYAGTINPARGYEVWKLEGPDGSASPRLLISGGNGSLSQQGVSEMFAFGDYLYVPSVVFVNLDRDNGGFSLNFNRGAELSRIDIHDAVQQISGRRSIVGLGPGLGELSNGYLWTLEQHNGKLYCGTWNAANFIPLFVGYFPDVRATLLDWVGVDIEPLYAGWWTPRPADWWNEMVDAGARLYESADGVVWTLVLDAGLGDRNSYGVRNLESVGDTLYIGLANVHDGLQVWAWKPE